MTQQLSFDVSRDPGRVTVAISGDLDMAGTLKLEPKLHDLVRDAAPGELVIDLRGVDFMDSVGLGLLIEAHLAASAAGAQLTILRGSSSVQRVFEVAGCHEVLPFVDEPVRRSE